MTSLSAHAGLDAGVIMAVRAWTDAKYADELVSQVHGGDIVLDLEAFRNPAGDAPDAPTEIRCSETDPTVCNTLACPTGAQPCFSQDCPGPTEPTGPGGPGLETFGMRCITQGCPSFGWDCEVTVPGEGGG